MASILPGQEGEMQVLMCMAAMFLAGSSVVVGKMLVLKLPVFLTAFCSLVVAFGCMLPLMYGRLHEIRALNGRSWRYLFLQGLCGIVLFRAFTLYGLHYTSAAQAGIITGTTPAVLALLSLILLGERVDFAGLAGIFCAIGGTMLILLDSLHGSAKGTLLGGLLVGLAVVSEALFTVFRKRVADSVSAVTNTTVLIFCSLLLLAPPAILELCSLSAPIDAESLLAILYYGIFATVIAYLLWTGAVGNVSSAVAGATTAVMPASSVLLAGMVLGEDILPQQLAGCVCIMAGIFISSCARLLPERFIPAADRKNK